jgi:hypothetical protein
LWIRNPIIQGAATNSLSVSCHKISCKSFQSIQFALELEWTLSLTASTALLEVNGVGLETTVSHNLSGDMTIWQLGSFADVLSINCCSTTQNLHHTSDDGLELAMELDVVRKDKKVEQGDNLGRATDVNKFGDDNLSGEHPWDYHFKSNDRAMF